MWNSCAFFPIILIYLQMRWTLVWSFWRPLYIIYIYMYILLGFKNLARKSGLLRMPYLISLFISVWLPLFRILCQTNSSICKRFWNMTVKGVKTMHTKIYVIWSKISGTLRASKITIFLNFSVNLLYCWYVLFVTSHLHATCCTKKANKANSGII